MKSHALVTTAAARRYMGQMCKHFGHKLPVELTDSHGTIAFPIGTCLMEAGPEGLRLSAEAADEPSLSRLQEVIASHLVRFAFRETPAIVWAPIAA